MGIFACVFFLYFNNNFFFLCFVLFLKKGTSTKVLIVYFFLNQHSLHWSMDNEPHYSFFFKNYLCDNKPMRRMQSFLFLCLLILIWINFIYQIFFVIRNVLKKRKKRRNCEWKQGFIWFVSFYGWKIQKCKPWTNACLVFMYKIRVYVHANWTFNTDANQLDRGYSFSFPFRVYVFVFWFFYSAFRVNWIEYFDLCGE